MKILSLVLLGTGRLLPAASQEDAPQEVELFEATCENWNLPCPEAFPQTECKVDPCETDDCANGTKCRPNYCGRCAAVCCAAGDDEEEEETGTDAEKDEPAYCRLKDIRTCPDGTLLFRDPRLGCEFPRCEKQENGGGGGGGLLGLVCGRGARLCSDKVTKVYRDPSNGCRFDDCPSSADDEKETTIADEETKDALLGVESAEIVGASMVLAEERENEDGETDVVNESGMEEEEEFVRPCPKDIRDCPDGTWVFRDPSNDCQFSECPSSFEEIREPEAKPCPKDLRACPDGVNFVARDPFNDCEFYDCPESVESQNVMGCPDDARMCPDGETVVVRDPHNDCEFEACPKNKPLDVVFCPEDARMCPDGETVVVRDPHNDCEFEACPKNKPLDVVFCPEDVRKCLDGTFVSRDPEHDCEFESCAEDEDEEAMTDILACPEDARMCPDGKTVVVRDPHNKCEFEPCSTSTSAVFCPADVRECPDGTYVSRDHDNNCAFRRCPDECDSDVRVCGDLSTVGRNQDKCCVFRPCPDETFLETIERKVQEMACDAASFNVRPRPRSGN